MFTTKRYRELIAMSNCLVLLAPAFIVGHALLRCYRVRKSPFIQGPAERQAHRRLRHLFGCAKQPLSARFFGWQHRQDRCGGKPAAANGDCGPQMDTSDSRLWAVTCCDPPPR